MDKTTRARPILLVAPLFAATVALVALAATHCGDSAAPVCGNGVVEMGEQCDAGERNGQRGVNCSADCRSISVLIPQIQVSWSLLNKSVVADYDGTNCDAIGANRAQVVLSGPTPLQQTLDCARKSKVISGACGDGADGGTGDCTVHLLPGKYQTTVTLLRDGTPITRAVTSESKVVQPGPPVDLNVDFEQQDFLSGYTGSLVLYETSWGADKVTCKDAMPPVERQSLLLLDWKNRQPLAMSFTTNGGTHLDGTPGACYTPMGGIPIEEAKNVPWGPYHLVIQGFAAGSSEATYCGAFDVFVGPGSNPQSWHKVVPLRLAAGDGGSPMDGDTPADGGSPDGGASDCP